MNCHSIKSEWSAPALFIGTVLLVSGCIAKTVHEVEIDTLADAQNEIVKLSTDSAQIESKNGRAAQKKGEKAQEAKGAQHASVATDKPLNFIPLKTTTGATTPEVGHEACTVHGIGCVVPPDQRVLLKKVTPNAVKEPRFDINVDSAPSREFFMGLVKDTQYNIMVHPGISGVISLNLKNVTVSEVVDTACELYGYTCSKNGVGHQILPQSVQLRQFRLYYPNVLRSGNSATQVSSGQKSSSTSTSKSDKGSTESKSESVSGSGVKTEYRSDFWGELTNTLCALLGLEIKEASTGGKDRNLSCQTDKKDKTEPSSGPGDLTTLADDLKETGAPASHPQAKPATESITKAISVSPQTGVIMIRAFPAEMRQLKSLLDDMQASLLQQVVLEAKILEVTLSEHFQSGINWSFVSQLKGSKEIGAGQTGGGTAFEAPTLTNPSNLDAYAGSLPLTLVRDGMPVSSLGGVFAVNLALNDFNSFLELLKGQGNVSVLSSPRIATLNNQKAMIKVGVDDIFVTNVEKKTNPTTGVEEDTVTFTPYFSGVALDVMPQIVGKDQLILHIHPSVTEVSDKRKMVLNQAYDLASMNMRESDSMVFSRSGEVIVIGGLMKVGKKNARQSVPVLADIPFVGELFGHRLASEQKSELVILMRATIAGDKDFWRDELKAAQERMGSISPNPPPAKPTTIN